MLPSSRSADVRSSPVETIPPPFACATRQTGHDEVWTHLSGEIDISAVDELVLALHLALLSAHQVVIDLRDVEFMDVSGLHGIVNASNRARRAGRRVVVIRGPAHVDRLFTATGTSTRVKRVDLASAPEAGLTLPALDHMPSVA